MNVFGDHADRGVEQSYAISRFSERIVINSYCLIDPLVGNSGDAYHNSVEQLVGFVEFVELLSRSS